MGQVITRIKIIHDEKKERKMYKNIDKQKQEIWREKQYVIDKKIERDLIDNYN
uniref:Uncharacterized protein n=1 Tax=viral metagenome TaxID=1070528 RepID=A0A6C0KJB3_9ZZZZ